MSANIITKQLKIDGMTCVSCETRIEKKLKGTGGIKSAKVSYNTGTATVTYDENVISLAKIIGVIERLDYKVKLPTKSGESKGNITQILGISVIILAAFMLFSHFGGSTLINSFPQAKEGMGYGMLFVIGLLTSIHCVAMCGGINLSQCIPKSVSVGGEGSKTAALKPSILYNLGRVISYTVIGAIVGALGSVVSFSGAMKGIVQLLAGVFMIIMGLNMLNLFPSLRKLAPRMPKFLANKVDAQKQGKGPLIVGLLNGLMPCGPLQAMQIYALSTGSPVKGALSMFLFSVGTVPLMFGLGALSSALSKKFMGKMVAVGGVLVMVLGVFMFGNGISLSGIELPTFKTSAKTSNTGTGANTAQVANGTQTVTTTVTPNGYEPITVQKGVPVKWIFKAADGALTGCNNSIVVPKFGIEQKLSIGETVVEFTPTEAGTFGYSCWMGMIRSKITVVDSVSSVTDGVSSNGGAENGTNNQTVPDDTGIPNCCGVN